MGPLDRAPVAALPSRVHRADALHVLLRHRLLPQPDGVEGGGAIQVVVGFDDESVSQPVHDSEGLRIRRIAGGVLPDGANAGDETAIAQVDQVIYAHLERSHQLDEALHALERRGTTPIDTSVGPAGPLSIDRILSPELFDHSRRTELVPHLVGTPDCGGILLRHRLALQPHCFKGGGFSREETEPDGLLPPPPPNVPGRLPHSDAAIGGATPNLNFSQRDMAEIAQLNDFDLVIGPSGEQVLPPAVDPLVAVENALHGSQARNGLGVSIDEFQEGSEVASVDRLIGLVSQLYVFLRHRLFPQPCRFEGLALAAERGPPGHLAVSQLDGLPHRLLNRDAAQRAGHADVCDTPVAGRTKVEQLPSHVLEGAADCIPPGTQSVTAAEG